MSVVAESEPAAGVGGVDPITSRHERIYYRDRHRSHLDMSPQSGPEPRTFRQVCASEMQFLAI